MATRDWTWQATDEFVRLGDDGRTSVPAWISGTGIGHEGAPDLYARFEVRDGTPECVEFRLVAKPDGRAVRSADLRLFNLDNLTLNTFMRFARSSRPGGTWASDDDERAWWLANSAVAESQRGSRGVTNAELTEVARIYRENVDGRPTEAVEMGMAYRSRRTAARRVEQARAVGLLPPTKPGQKRA
jgi:hypothetical protein